MGAASSDPGDAAEGPEPEVDGVEVLIDVVRQFRGRIDEHLLERAVREALNAARSDRPGEWADSPTTPKGTQRAPARQAGYPAGGTQAGRAGGVPGLGAPLGAAPPGFPTQVPARAEVSIHVTDDAEMRRLNAKYRRVDRPTDVLSFSFFDEEIGRGGQPAHPPGLPIQLGEIAISLTYAERQASELGHTLGKELAWLIIHGALQLLGYTHETEEQAVHMEALEQRALRAMGLA